MANRLRDKNQSWTNIVKLNKSVMDETLYLHSNQRQTRDSKMSEKKVVRRNVAIALGIVCILLIAGIGGAMAYYTMVINDKNTAYDNYASSHSHTNSGFNTLNQTYQDYLATHSHSNVEYDAYVANHHYTDAEYNSLNATYQDYLATHSHTNSEYDDYVATHHHSDAEYDAIKSERDALKAPKLIFVGFNAEDVTSGVWHLHVWGGVCNVGTDTAYNCKIHIIAYQAKGPLPEAYITLGTGTMLGETSTWVDSNPIYYVGGGALTNWTYTLEWTATP
jgi:hypothetical protein